MKNTNNKLSIENGFTIVELMIATTILSVILLLATIIIISIGNLYYKGITQTSVQDSIRNMADDIIQKLQLENGIQPGVDTNYTPNIQVYCIGATRYSFIKEVQIGHQQVIGGIPVGPVFNEILWKDAPNGGCRSDQAADLTNSNLLSISPDGAELAPPRSRITEFSITGTSPYKIVIGFAVGDDDQLTGTGINTLCTGQASDQFCATDKLLTSVVKRL